MNEKFPLRYCITCERIVATLDGEFHTIIDWDKNLVECDGPFALSTPPDNFGENWDIDLVEPDGDEMFIINRNAEQLLADFIR